MTPEDVEQAPNASLNDRVEKLYLKLTEFTLAQAGARVRSE